MGDIRFDIYTDSSCDLPKEIREKNGISLVPLRFNFYGDSQIYMEHEVDENNLYERVGKGERVISHAVSEKEFTEAFKASGEKKRDVLYISMSSSLSDNFKNAAKACQTYLAEYPGSKILVLDSQNASLGLGLTVLKCCELRESGLSLQETFNICNEFKNNVSGYFTVNTLDYLKQSGSYSSCLSSIYKLFDIHPILKFDDNGAITRADWAKGKKNAILLLAEDYKSYAADLSGTVLISYGGNKDDALYLKSLLESEYGASVSFVSPLGAVNLGHTGLETIAVFFKGI